jgi:hypothetical protein
MSEKEEEEAPPANENDLVIRDGFPALKRRDGKGPLISGEEPLPRHSFASFANALHICTPKTVLGDCEKVFTARTRDDGAAYSAGCTYFIPSEMKPRCALEGLALQIFHAHVKDLDGTYNPSQSGAEWWTLVIDANKPKITSRDDGDDGDDEEEEDDDEVGMHFDADYGLEEQMPNILLHPRVATVTYLSNVGAPTIVLDKHSPPPCDPEKKSLNGDVQRAWLSGPQFGKHIAFDGRLLHGAPALFFPGSTTSHAINNGEEERSSKRPKLEHSSPEKRVTFLVNIWLNHCPLDAELLDDDICEQMETPWEPPTLDGTKSDPAYKPPFEWNNPDVCNPDSTETVSLDASKENPAGTDEGVICDRIVTFSYGPTMEELHAASSTTADGASVELELGTAAISLLVGAKVDEEEDKV